MRRLLAALLLAAAPVAAARADDGALQLTAAQRAVPAQLDAEARAAYAQAFRDLDAGRLSAVRAVIGARPDGLLTPVLEAQLMLKRRPGAATLGDWVQRNGDLPQSARLAEMA